MFRLGIRISFFVHLITLSNSVEFDLKEVNPNHQNYDFNGLIEKSLTRFYQSRDAKDAAFLDSLDLFRDNKIEHLKEYFQNFTPNGSKCALDFLYTFQSVTNTENKWALRLLDSYGKPDSGILQGNFRWPGEFTECISVYAPPKRNSSAGNFHGKYCSLSFGSPNSNPSQMVMSPSIGVCIPDSCDSSEVKKGLVQLFHSNTGALPFNATLTCMTNERELSDPAIAVIALMSVFCALTVLGSSITIIKYFCAVGKEFQKKPSAIVTDIQSEETKRSKSDEELLLQGNRHQFQEKCEEFLACFCIFKNGAKLLNTNVNEGELLCIHGIRFLSMSWVILGHAYLFCFAESRNVLEAIQLVDSFLFQIVLQGFFSVDSFFVLSGFLLGYLSMKEFSKTKGKISWPYFYIHRYLRLTPIYMIVLGFSASLYFYIGSGPFWPNSVSDPLCEKSWWRNLIYINNFGDMTGQCMGWSWYLANDMQFFVISPLFLIALWRWPKIGYGLVVVFLLANFLANFFITYHFDMPCGIVDLLHMPRANATVGFENTGDFFDKLYIKPYTRIGPYLIGLLTGYLLFKRKMNQSPKHGWIMICIGWILASTVTLTVVYGLYHTYPPVIARSFYNAFNRTCFAMGLSWVIYVCLVGQGGFINSILSYKGFIPLSRLTYSAYLIHPLIMMWYYSSLKTPLQFTHPTMVTLFLGLLVLSYALSLPVTLVFESPLLGLEKMLRKSLLKNKS